MAAGIAVGSGQLQYQVKFCKGQGSRQTAWISRVTLNGCTRTELSWPCRVSRLSKIRRCNFFKSAISENWKAHRTVTVSSCLKNGSTKYFDFAVIGSGVAGLRYALEVAKHGTVAIITKAEPHESNTNYAQGGVSAVLCPSDSVESHMQDTIVAGAYLCDEETVRVVCTEGPQRIRELIAMGASFDHGEDGNLHLAREGGHSHHRIVHAADMTGKEIERALLEAVVNDPNIVVFKHHFAIDLLTSQDGSDTVCHGVDALNIETQKVVRFISKVTLLASGGAGHIYPSNFNSRTTHLKNRVFFPQSLVLSSSSSSSKRATFCSWSSNNGGSNTGLQSGEIGEPFVLTTPLYYVNAPPHMGSAYTTIAADAIARFQRLLGKKVIFITGTDEHGEKIATAAAANGSSPSEHCDVIAQSYKKLWKDLDIAYDKFIRTTDPKHETIVKEFYSRVLAKGDIYRADYEGLYCVNCEEYKDEKELLENNCCPVHLKPCVPRKEDNYFFALSKYQKILEETLSENPHFVQPSFRLNEVQSWIKNGLKDFSISRESVEWGIPVPNDIKQTIYVWFDALLGYISALSDKEGHNLQIAVSSGWPASLHLIGKDILRFHAVYWPAMLMSAGLNLPKVVFGHGFLTKDGMKMGKSLGNTIEPKELVSKFGPDAIRYFFLREVEFGNDGDYSEDRFINVVNAHLANTIGNLLNRTLGLLKKNCESTLVADAIVAAEGNTFKDTVEKLVEKARIQYENLSLSSACEAVLEIGNSGNSYMDEQAPWSLFKQGGAASEAAAKDLVIILETMRIIAVALSPVTPNLSQRIYAQLGYSEDEFKNVTWKETKWGGLKGGQVMAQPKPVFARIEQTGTEDENLAVKRTVKKKEKVQQVKGVAQV